jgi:hypothetical protein
LLAANSATLRARGTIYTHINKLNTIGKIFTLKMRVDLRATATSKAHS